jgi:glycerophosphoryl diester phosphodiesterase
MKNIVDKYRFVIGGAIALAIVGIVVYIYKKGKKSGINNIINNSKVLVCSHITAIDSNAGTKAENNLKNISLLLTENIGMIEIDVQITKDGVPVLFHDNDLSPKTNMSGSISNLNWAQVQGARYKSDNSQGITKLSDAIEVLKKSGKPTIFQLDKCDKNEIAKIDSLGLFKGVEKQMMAKALSFQAADSIKKAGILYMPMLPTKYVGKMTTEAIINEIAQQCKGSQFIEAQFSDADTLLINGALSKKLAEVGCKLFVVAVGGAPTTNSVSFRGDSIKQWSKMINPMSAGAIMTNKPLALKKYVDSL